MHLVALLGFYVLIIFNNKLVINIWVTLFLIDFEN